MADETHASVSGPNGERLQLQIGTKSIGIATKDLVPILLLLGGIVGGYLLWVAVDRRLEFLVLGQAQLADTSRANKEAVIDALHDHRQFIVEQVQQGLKRQEQQAEVLQRLLLVLDLPVDIMGGTKPLKPIGP